MSRRTARTESPPPNPYAHVRGMMAAAHDGLHAFVRGKIAEAGLELAVTGVPAEVGDGPCVLLLTYQSVLEAQASANALPLVPQTSEADRSMVPEPWRRLGRLATTCLVETYPKREARGPGLGPLDPLPRLEQLPASVRAWYEAHAEDWLVDVSGRPHARLPFVSWRPSFPLALRVAALVPAGRNPPPNAGRTALEGLGVLAAAVRLGRSFEYAGPPIPVGDDIRGLLGAFSKVGGAAAAELAELLPALDAPLRVAVGLTAHHELGDTDLAEVARTLQMPIQPGIVFSFRLVLGGGPELGPGALPHLGSVTPEPR